MLPIRGYSYLCALNYTFPYLNVFGIILNCNVHFECHDFRIASLQCFSFLTSASQSGPQLNLGIYFFFSWNVYKYTYLMNIGHMNSLPLVDVRDNREKNQIIITGAL